MAYIKIFPIKVTDKKALDYITNPDKTDEKLLVSSFSCSPETADLEFSMTREMVKKNGMDKGNNLAFHLIQSFKPGEVDAETAHRLGQQFADEVLKGKYEYVISTHVDKNHIHNHIIFNAASFVDHHKYISNKRSYHKICRISNRICQENGLATSMPTEEKGKNYKENMEYHRGTSWKAKLRVTVDKAIWSSVNYDEFLQKMQLAGYEVRQGKHLSFRAPEQKNFTYMKSLGSYYTEENVRARLEKNRYKTKALKHLSREARLYINISTYVTTGNREGFERWAKLNNLKEAARTFNYLSENNLLNYEDFQQHISDIENSIKAVDQRFEEISTELGTQKLIQKHCDSYRLCRKVIEDCKSAKNPKAYRTKHQAEYQLHDSLKKELQDLGVTKIPSSEKLQKRIESLESEQAATVREKQDLQNKIKTLNIIQQNFSSLLDTHEITIYSPDHGECYL
jgi:arsenate reductase-like glutaredoxin family protein